MWRIIKSTLETLFTNRKPPPVQIGNWVFDETVASRFTREAEQHIPNYWEVIQLTVSLIEKSFQKQATILEIGCATGNTLAYLVSRHFDNLFGCDSSAAMLTKARDFLQNNQVILIESDCYPSNVPLFEVVICNWTMHFIKQREEYLKAIFNGLVSGGLFIMTEKTVQSNGVKMLYYDFKLKQGLTLDQIEQKEQHLLGVLIPQTVEQNISMLRKTGFINVEILNAAFGFVTFLAWKP
ncbi:MAG: carboxy-S-adenosyl-L-methionine synthase CmoA [Pseudomonadota bacterium]